MPTDPNDIDSYSPEQKQRFYEEWLASEEGRRFQKEQRRGETWETLRVIVAWIVIGGLGLIVGIAILKWVVEELAK